VFSKIAPTLLSMALATALAATAHAQELSDEQRAEIEARIAPIGSVCLQGENCGGLPEKASAPMAAAPKPAAPAATASSDSSDDAADDASSNAGMAASDEEAGNASESEGSEDAASEGESEEIAGATPSAAEDPASASESASEETVASASPPIDGEAIYNQACMACHMSGVGGAPVVGDIDSWSPRIAKGVEALHSSAINGVAGTAMMAKGGRMDLSDQQVMAAVDYMVSTSQ